MSSVPAPAREATHASLRTSGAPERTTVPFLLRLTAGALFVLPANMVIEPLGALGNAPMLMAIGLSAFWVVSAAFGLHDPIGYRHPGRVALAALLLATCVSYGALAIGLTGGATVSGRAGADRWLIFVLVSVVLALITTEVVRTLDDAMVLIRAILAGALFCCVVALIQFVFRINPVEWIEAVMVGFVDNGGQTPFQPRGAFMRVAGTTFHPIELGVVSAMLLPISIWRSLYDKRGWKPFHWLGTALLVFTVVAPVSRSGVLSILIATVISTPFLPAIARKWALIVLPAAVTALFVTIPGLISTLFGSFAEGSSDPSVTTRLDDFPRVIELVSRLPLTGSGPGTYLPANALEILDNEYYLTAVNMGVTGLIAMFIYLAVPAVFTFTAASYAKNLELRALAGAVAAAGFVATVASATFDSLSFPVFALLYPLFIGLGGFVWIEVRRETATHSYAPPVPRRG